METELTEEREREMYNLIDYKRLIAYSIYINTLILRSVNQLLLILNQFRCWVNSLLDFFYS